MENYSMRPGLKLMSLGFNCYLTLLEERIRGPFDNMVCDSIKHLQAIFNKEYLNISVEESKTEEPSAEDLARIEEFKKKGWIK